MVDMWGGTPSAQEFPNVPPTGYRALLDKIRELERQIGAARSALLEAAGISVDDAGMTIDSGLQVNGLLSVVGPLVLADGAINQSAVAGFTSGTAAPAAGTWRRSTVCWNAAPTGGSPAGWMCVTSGTPGVWKAMANLAA